MKEMSDLEQAIYHTLNTSWGEKLLDELFKYHVDTAIVRDDNVTNSNIRQGKSDLVRWMINTLKRLKEE